MAKIYYREVQDFEPSVINKLIQYKWDSKVLKNSTEEDLIENWRKILSFNNNSIDKLNGYPLTKTEMAQILAQVNEKHSAYSLNSFINGGSIQIKRDCEEDTLHCGKMVSLKIYDRNEIAGGKSIYQIVEQPQFKKQNALGRDRRGDLMLLINGMPVIHIELKKSGIPISQATNQIQKYSEEGIFTGIFALIQIFIAMTPDEVIYFANNPDSLGRFNDKYFFHWGDFYNRRIDDWEEFTRLFLHIPMAHELIGFYTIADKQDKNLKILRSYQYYAVREIQNQVIKHDWEDKNQRGGLIWHTTGSGKTLTSFKCADLISKTDRADKVIFLVDRKNLDEQTYSNYCCFADSSSDIQNVSSTYELLRKLKSTDSSDRLIICSIQKLARLHDEGTIATLKDLEKINTMRLIFIVDECHRDTFGEMMLKIKRTFTHSLFFGFSGTPIFDTNSRDGSKTSDVFGNELHRYTIGDGMKDGNVLGFDPRMIRTYNDDDLRKKYCLKTLHTDNIDEITDESKKQAYYQIMNELNMLEIEQEFKPREYNNDDHHNAVLKNIISTFNKISHNHKFHQIFATYSIEEALEYYKLFKISNKIQTNLKVTVVVDSNEDNSSTSYSKEQKLIEVIDDYNKTFGTSFTLPTYSDMKKDVCERLAHHFPYNDMNNHPEERLDIVIVVNQMLTGYDSKFVNTLHIDKLIEEQNLIQAISRTNRLCDNDKPFGIIYYYRKPYTMEQNLKNALKTYSGENNFEIFVPKLIENLINFNAIFTNIKQLFESENIQNFERLMKDGKSRQQFARCFKNLVACFKRLEVQDFSWKKTEYLNDKTGEIITCLIDELTYNILFVRYNELAKKERNRENTAFPLDIDTSISEVAGQKIDADYMNSRFKKFIRLNVSKEEKAVIDRSLDDLYSSFRTLDETRQNYARVIVSDIQTGKLVPNENKSLNDYINYYINRDKNNKIQLFAKTFGINFTDFKALVYEKSFKNSDLENIKRNLDTKLVIDYFKTYYNKTLSSFSAKMEFDKLIREFIQTDGESFNPSTNLEDGE